MNGLPIRDFAALAPVAILAFGALALMLTEVFLTTGRRGYQAVVTVAIAALTALACLVVPPAGPVFGGQATVDAFSVFTTLVICLGVALSALVSAGWLRAREAERGEYYALTLFAASGMSLLGMASDLLIAFVAIEIMSLSTYALSAYLRRGKRPSEAAFKYMILGAISSALLLYGSSLIFGATGTTLFSGMQHGARGTGGPLLVAGLALVASGIAFKIAAVPFHAWTPDVYEGAPTPVTAFMAAGVKTAAFALLARIFLSSQTGAQVADVSFTQILTVLGILTMVFGNLLALPQRSVKRMLAYSSVAHAGYLLVGVVSAKVEGARSIALAGVLFYLAAYTATVVGAFAVVGAIEARSRGDAEPARAWDLSRFSGLAKTNPTLAFAMTVFLLSLAGVPPTAGFVGKLYIFKAAVGAQLYPLAIAGVLTSILGAFYYLRVIVHMYMRPAEGEAVVPVTAPAMALALGGAVAVVAILGVLGDPLVRLAQAASAVVM
ncbi:MAG TPA: NADH-quinone oxidoreductase subunit N [Anaeromyxobacteraceae bacterium]|nr:NADH-quinone oxidoreductase subunit N [Anaeromyxobacteraceae bacterium]